MKKSKRNGLLLTESSEFGDFFSQQNDLVATKYNSAPAHSGAEMELLASRFPENIRMFLAYEKSEIIAGIILFISRRVMHCQYIGANNKGHDLHALDFITDQLLSGELLEYEFFDFGTSNLQGGRYLESTLIQNKESYGGRTVCYDTYEVAIK